MERRGNHRDEGSEGGREGGSTGTLGVWNDLEPGSNLSLVPVGEAAVPAYTERRAVGPNMVDIVGL